MFAGTLIIISLSNYNYRIHSFEDSGIDGKNKLALKYKKIFTSEVTEISKKISVTDNVENIEKEINIAAESQKLHI